MAHVRRFKHVLLEEIFPVHHTNEMLYCSQSIAFRSSSDSAEALLPFPVHPTDRHNTALHTGTRKTRHGCHLGS